MPDKFATLRGFRYPTRAFVPGSTRIPPPRPLMLEEVLADWQRLFDKKKQKHNDELAHQSAEHHRKVTAERDLPPDPGEIQVAEHRSGQKQWQF